MGNFVRNIFAVVGIALYCFSATPVFAQNINWEEVKILVYTKNGEGFVHDNISNSIEAFQSLGKEHGFQVDTSEDPADFTQENLRNYDIVVFSNTNNDVFDTDEQRVAFMRYIQAGGGFVGIHSASGTERHWPWFKRLVGGTFLWHEPYQKFTVKILDKDHPSLAHLPKTWEREDELYYLGELSVNLNVLAVNDMSTLTVPDNQDRRKPMTFGTIFPSVWSQEFDGGRQWYTSLGHNKKDYKDPEFRKHILGGLISVLGKQKPLDYSKAYAQSPTDFKQ